MAPFIFLLKILKIILIVLAIILVVVIAALCIPLKYRIHFAKGDDTDLEAEFVWLFQLFKYIFKYSKKDGKSSKNSDLIICGISLKDKKNKKKEKRRRERKKKLDKLREKDPALYDKMKEDAARRRKEREEENKERAKRTEESQARSNRKISEGERNVGLLPRLIAGIIKVLKRFAAGLAAAFVRILVKIIFLPYRLIYKIFEFIGKTGDKLAKIKDTAAFACDVRTGRGLVILIKRVIKLISHIKPKIRGSAVFGVGDPAYTGEIYGILCSVYPVYTDELSISPDFDQMTYRGDILASGRAYPLYVAKEAAAALLDKNVIYFISGIRGLISNKEEEDG